MSGLVSPEFNGKRELYPLQAIHENAIFADPVDEMKKEISRSPSGMTTKKATATATV
jgi:hypothetical protein